MWELVASREAKQFTEASARFREGEKRAESIETMMRLALQGRTITIKRWAQVFLKEQCNVEVECEGNCPCNSVQGSESLPINVLPLSRPRATRSALRRRAPARR